MITGDEIPGITHMEKGANLLAGNSLVSERTKLSNAFEFNFNGKISQGDRYMIPDAIFTSQVGAVCANQSNIKLSPLVQSDSIENLRVSSHKYSTWSVESNSNFTQSLDMQTILMWSNASPNKEQNNLRHHIKNKSFTANA